MSKEIYCSLCGKHLITIEKGKVAKNIDVHCLECEPEIIVHSTENKSTDTVDFLKNIFGCFVN